MSREFIFIQDLVAREHEGGASGGGCQGCPSWLVLERVGIQVN